MDLMETGYKIVNWVHKRPMTSFLKDGNDYSGSTKSAKLL